MTARITKTALLELTGDLASAWLSNPDSRIAVGDVGALIARIHGALVGAAGASSTSEQAQEEFLPAVTARKSLASKDHLISLIDGEPYKTLKRHLSGNGLTPDQYRERYGLKADYPMVSESYSQTRRDLAKKIGLGRKPGHKAAAAKAPKPRAHKAAAEAEA